MNSLSAHTVDQSLPPVALVHGWGSSYDRTWRGTWLEGELLARGRTVIPVALPGHSPVLTSARPEDYAEIADQLWRMLEHLGCLDGVGFSLGGKLLLRLAAEHPTRFRRLVIAGVGENLFSVEKGEAVSSALLHGIPQGAPHGLRQVVEEALASGNDLSAMAAVISRPPRTFEVGLLARITAEVLMVAGENDDIARSPDPVTRSLPNGRQILIPALGHVETPALREVQECALTFLIDGLG
ncbi:alpha/beta hydrolase [Pseudarthrobacter sp. HLT3-5]|uniref:alpha/beta fold hydrolase n=1 Tax=Pseudarthrobacter cellobiosi TaxID=2953654 RepID=UPI00208ED8B0|nr:alpha/beta hydrolase [Pseudarthrobacter sp. HLT3-5]MCO4273812.1 alpha/beta hydrolase [Pseudarthrobacter sp. HLT3-5]